MKILGGDIDKTLKHNTLMYTTSRPYTEFTCPFELFKDMVKTKSCDEMFHNHACLHRESTYSFIEFNYDFVESAINCLKDKTVLVSMGIDSFTPSDLLLFEFLKEYGLETAFKAIKRE